MAFDGDYEAWETIKYTHGVTRGGIIYPYKSDRPETPLQTRAINYLCSEWDYAYEKEKPR
jgi:hypothetical protein